MEELAPEAERESLLNIVQNIRQQSNPVARLLYVAKTNTDSKKDLDACEDTEQWIKNNCQNEEATGILLVIGPYVIHLFEAPSENAIALMKHIREVCSNPIPPYIVVNVINFTEENPVRNFTHWMKQTIQMQGSSTEQEILDREVPQRSYEIYRDICEIGTRITAQLAGKPPTGPALDRAIKTNALQLIPPQETLLMLVSSKFTPLQKLYDEYIEPQDVCLDNEYIWPVPAEIEF